VATRLLRYLAELGYTRSGGMGPLPLSYEEIAAWARLTRTPLSWWEVTTLRQLSCDYVDMLSRATDDRSLPAPYPERSAQAQSAAQRDTLLRSFGFNPKKKETADGQKTQSLT
jgi:hypothetical protein